MKNEELAKLVLDWWEDAQYMESSPGRNMFDFEPDFVESAQRILPNRKEDNGSSFARTEKEFFDRIVINL